MSFGACSLLSGALGRRVNEKMPHATVTSYGDMQEMVTDDELENIPSDPDEALCYLVEILRQKVRAFNIDERRNWDIEREYINLVRGFLSEYGIEIGAALGRDPPIDDGAFSEYYHEFNVIMDQRVAAARIRVAMQRKQDKIPLNAATKARITRHIQQIREILQKIDIPVDKRDQILIKLNKFAQAIDTERTDIRRILDVTLEVADTGDEVAKKLVDVREHINSITGLLAEARRWAERKVLGTTWRAPRQIEAPSKQLPAPSTEFDDDIPF